MPIESLAICNMGDAAPVLILYTHIGVRVCRSSIDDKGRLKQGYSNG